VRYHNHHVPRLLHWLGFSVQRPRKKLSKADSKKQERWCRFSRALTPLYSQALTPGVSGRVTGAESPIWGYGSRRVEQSSGGSWRPLIAAVVVRDARASEVCEDARRGAPIGWQQR
jgi:hypothetical protein